MRVMLILHVVAAGLCARYVEATNQLDAMVAAHAQSMRAKLANVTACRAGGCSRAWLRREAAWRSAEAAADGARLAAHRRLFGDFLPLSGGPVQAKPTRRGFSVGGKFEGTFCAHDYFDATYACGSAARRPAAVGDGPKWFCGFDASAPPRDVVSLGSNFDDSFEVAAAAEGAAPYIVDPTLEQKRGRAALDGFASRVAAYGGAVNASVGVGDGVWNTRRGAVIRLVPLAALLADRYHSPRGGLRLAGLKMDVEGAEFVVLAEVAALCRSGVLAVDELWVEVHLSLERTAGEFYHLLHGLLHCDLMLFRKEVNTWGCDNRCAEYAFVSVAHARRVFEAERREGRRLRGDPATDDRAPRG